LLLLKSVKPKQRPNYRQVLKLSKTIMERLGLSMELKGSVGLFGVLETNLKSKFERQEHENLKPNS
jgi:hypothetical protein